MGTVGSGRLERQVPTTIPEGPDLAQWNSNEWKVGIVMETVPICKGAL